MLPHLAKLAVEHRLRHRLAGVLIVLAHYGASCIPYRSADVYADIEECEILIVAELYGKGALLALIEVFHLELPEFLTERDCRWFAVGGRNLPDGCAAPCKARSEQGKKPFRMLVADYAVVTFRLLLNAIYHQ